MGSTKERLTADKFCRLYMKAYRAGKSQSEFAESLGVCSQQISTRKYSISTRYKVVFPKLVQKVNPAAFDRAALLAILKTDKRRKAK